MTSEMQNGPPFIKYKVKLEMKYVQKEKLELSWEWEFVDGQIKC